MQLSLDAEEVALQAEARAFLDRHLPAPSDVPRDFDERIAFLRGWQAELHAARLVGVSWPTEYGGRGMSPSGEVAVYQELARAGAPKLVGRVGVSVVGPSIVAYGTAGQKSAHLGHILSGEELWCQGFSEPEAGSDLASLKTQAVDAGDHFVLRGQKTWTSNLLHAQWCAVLARTDPDAPPHRGISYLLVDLDSAGVERRSLTQVTGDPEFGEVFFEDVLVPKENLLGPLHGGWQIAMHTLSHERGPAAMARQVLLSVAFDRLLQVARGARRDGIPAIEHPELRSRLARAHVAIEVLRYQTYRSAGLARAHGPGLEASIDRAAAAAAEQRLAAVALDVLGVHATVEGAPGDGVDVSEWRDVYLMSRAASVYGGSGQIQRNIIAERVLGLPRSS